MTVYLAKANNNLISHCDCDDQALISSTDGQMDCPWCGCGWLFSCIRCRKAFTFAQGVEVDMALRELVLRDLIEFCDDPLLLERMTTPAVINEITEKMASQMRTVEVGRVYVYLDGMIIPADHEGRLQGKGKMRRHNLPYVPQVEAMTNPEILIDVLENRNYWKPYKRD